jgi:hypothetical protein
MFPVRSECEMPSAARAFRFLGERYRAQSSGAPGAADARLATIGTSRVDTRVFVSTAIVAARPSGAVILSIASANRSCCPPASRISHRGGRSAVRRSTVVSMSCCSVGWSGRFRSVRSAVPFATEQVVCWNDCLTYSSSSRRPESNRGPLHYESLICPANRLFVGSPF